MACIILIPLFYYYYKYFIKIATAHLGGCMDWQIQKKMQRDQGVHVG